MPKHINLTGTKGQNYNLDNLTTENTRGDSSKELVVQIWHWNPNGIDAYLKESKEKFEEHKLPDPPNPKIGQIWLSRWVPTNFEEV